MSSSETSRAQAASIETAGTDPRRPALALAELVVAYLVPSALRLRDAGSEKAGGR